MYGIILKPKAATLQVLFAQSDVRLEVEFRSSADLSLAWLEVFRLQSSESACF